jgi:hypothetical protein
MRAFYDNYECASILRNKMDHLSEQIPNLAAAKKVRPPIYGALSYFLVQESDFETVNGVPVVHAGEIITITAGPFRRDTHVVAMPNPAARDIIIPVGQFQFLAFDSLFEIENAVRDLMAIAAPLEANIAHSVRQSIEAISEKEGVAIDTLMGTSLGQVVMRASVKFGGEA